MNMRPIVTAALLSGTLLLGLAITPTAFAMGGYTPDQVVTGTVQDIDYTHHAITVNGQTYAVSPQAKFSGIGAFSVLHVGMAVQCKLDSAAAKQTPTDGSQSDDSSASQPEVITAITWLPGGV